MDVKVLSLLIMVIEMAKYTWIKIKTMKYHMARICHILVFDSPPKKLLTHRKLSGHAINPNAFP